MPSVTNLSARDLDGVLGLVAEAAATDGDSPFELPVLTRLVGLVPARRAGYFEFEHGRPGNLCDTDTCHPDTFDWSAEENQAAIHSWPLLDSRRGCPAEALKLTDFLSPRELRRTRWYLDALRPYGNEHEMKLWLAAPTGFVRGFFFVRERGSTDFDERDRAVLTVLRSQLGAIRDRWERRHRPPGLTAREAEVVLLLREGLTNQEIADRLVISTGTVRTHLENVFEKLGVHTRTAAVARAYSVVGPDAGLP